MFNSVLEYTKQLESEIRSTGEFLRKVRGARIRLVNSIAKAEEQRKLANRPREYIEKMLPKFKREAFKYAKSRLAQHILWAVIDNPEFSREEYKKPLFEAAKDSDTFRFSMRTTNWNSIPRIVIDLNKTAGRLNMWGAAIKAYRKTLGVKIPRTEEKKKLAALAASRAWRRIYGESSSKLASTIAGRLRLAGAKAPFWSILNYGTPQAMSSDRGGFAFPTNEQTKFQSNAETEINEYLLDLYTEKKIQFEEYIASMNPFIEEAKKELLQMEVLIEQLTMDRQRNKIVEAGLGPTMQFVDRDKLAIAVDKIVAGLLTSGQVEVTVKGSKRTRLDVSRIAGLLPY